MKQKFPAGQKKSLVEQAIHGHHTQKVFMCSHGGTHDARSSGCVWEEAAAHRQPCRRSPGLELQPWGEKPLGGQEGWGSCHIWGPALEQSAPDGWAPEAWNHLGAELGGLQPVRNSRDQFGKDGILWEGLHMKQRQSDRPWKSSRDEASWTDHSPLPCSLHHLGWEGRKGWRHF